VYFIKPDKPFNSSLFDVKLFILSTKIKDFLYKILFDLLSQNKEKL
jgi:hypothetical protein